MKNSTRIVKYKSWVVKSNASSFDICCVSKTSSASYTKIPFSLNPITQEDVKTCKKNWDCKCNVRREILFETLYAWSVCFTIPRSGVSQLCQLTQTMLGKHIQTHSNICEGIW